MHIHTHAHLIRAGSSRKSDNFTAKTHRSQERLAIPKNLHPCFSVIPSVRPKCDKQTLFLQHCASPGHHWPWNAVIMNIDKHFKYHSVSN